MKTYLIGLTEEGIRRANLLMLRIPSPLPTPELSAVAQRCVDRLQENIDTLENIRDDPNLGNPEYFGIHLRILRRVMWSIFNVEVKALPPLARFTEDERFLTGLLFKLYQEIHFPLSSHPIAACFASDYYWCYPDTNIIYVPLTESETLLHLPDLAHEMGHILVHNLQDPRMTALRTHYDACRELINQHYIRQIVSRRTAGGPMGYLGFENHFRQQWQDKWLQEIVCDLFAVYVLGPPFLWAHCHLVAKTCEQIFWFSHESETSHPADEARMQAMQVALRLLGFQEESKMINIHWQEIAKVLGHKKDPDYHLAYPDELIESIAVEIYNAVNDLGCRLWSKSFASKSDDNSVTGLLNLAWKTFWKDTKSYPMWEATEIQKLRKGK